MHFKLGAWEEGYHKLINRKKVENCQDGSPVTLGVSKSWEDRQLSHKGGYWQWLFFEVIGLWLILIFFIFLFFVFL